MGEYVVMVHGAANRDPDVFGQDAQRFDSSRSPNPYLAFGFGDAAVSVPALPASKVVSL